MYCNQCQEVSKNVACTNRGVCGKIDEVANLQDLLIYLCKGLSQVAIEARKQGVDTNKENKFIVSALFMTITNANFDSSSITNAIKECIKYRDELKKKLKISSSEDWVNWTGTSDEDFKEKALNCGILNYDQDEDIRSMKQYVVYGLKGMAAYTEHAFNLGFEQDDIYEFIQEGLIMTTREQDIKSMADWLMRTGEFGVKAMALLDKANTSTYGNPEISRVKTGVGKNPGILVSGHDLKDLEDLLIQTEGKGIDIYTHSEMLPSHAYPSLKKYKHLTGNYGGAWYQQLDDFEKFNGPVVFTTNCLVPPRKSTTYNDRIFTTNVTGMPDWKHINNKLPNGQKDFSEVIELAKSCTPPTEIENGELTIGFAHNQVLQLADKILEAVNSGAIKKMVVMSGCDGRHKSREYYRDFALNLPEDTVILTSGCAKYRYNKLNLGTIQGIPRVLDAGQCNDSYSWALVALKLKEILGLQDINELPIVFNIAWYEQKAIIVHLALLYLGVKNTRIGPTLPGFLTPNVLNLLQEQFGIKTISSVDEDLYLLGLN